MNREESLEAKKKYVEARVDGKTQAESAVIAGYSPKTKPLQVENGCRSLMSEALKARGIDEDWIALQYQKGIGDSTKLGAKDKDLNAHAQYLKQLGFLLGYGKSGPSVAVQINNGTNFEDGALPARELLEEVESLVKILEAQVGRDRASGILQAGSGASDSQARSGMDEPSSEAPQAGGGG